MNTIGNFDVCVYELTRRYIIGEFASRDFAICLCKDSEES